MHIHVMLSVVIIGNRQWFYNIRQLWCTAALMGSSPKHEYEKFEHIDLFTCNIYLQNLKCILSIMSSLSDV